MIVDAPRYVGPGHAHSTLFARRRLFCDRPHSIVFAEALPASALAQKENPAAPADLDPAAYRRSAAENPYLADLRLP